ncbi:MAG: glutathione S-transferase family protein [Pararhizobium sp.]
MNFTLYIANKTYSSWSFRPWIAMKVKEVPFKEVLVPFDDAAGNPKFREFSPTGKVPALHHRDLTIWESLAILEYLADFFPEICLWPEDSGERAVARAVSTEMATGFRALRSACPMNMRRAPSTLAVDAAVRADVERIEALWTSLIERSGGPYLFGNAFGAADAMFAPVVNRFDVYRLTESTPVQAYMETIKALPAWQEWETAARDEPWVVPEDEV